MCYWASGLKFELKLVGTALLPTNQGCDANGILTSWHTPRPVAICPTCPALLARPDYPTFCSPVHAVTVVLEGAEGCGGE